MINTDTIQKEIEQEKQLNRMDDTNGKINPYELDGTMVNFKQPSKLYPT